MELLRTQKLHLMVSSQKNPSKVFLEFLIALRIFLFKFYFVQSLFWFIHCTADGKDLESTEPLEKVELKKLNPSDRKLESSGKDASMSSSPIADSLSKVKGSSISDKTVGILKKKAPALTDKELNPEFFQKLETRGSGDLPVEVVLPRRFLHSSHSQGDESELNDADSRHISNNNGAPGGESNDIRGPIGAKKVDVYTNKLQDADDYARDKWAEQRVFRGKDLKSRAFDVDDRMDINQRDATSVRGGFNRSDGHSEGHKGNWLAIQRQLSQLERQQANLMAMLQVVRLLQIPLKINAMRDVF